MSLSLVPSPSPVPEPAPRRAPFQAVAHSLVRVNNVPFQALRAPEAAATAEQLRRLQELSLWLRGVRDPLCDRLYRVVSEHLGDPAYRPLLELKRDIFSDRPSKVPAERALPLCDDGVLREWFERRTEATRLIVAIEAGHEARLAAERALVQQGLTNPDFLRATLLSSLDLQEAIDGYTGHRIAAHGKRQRKSEPALLSYLLRAMTRTSPYSFYTSVGFALPGAPAPLPAPLPEGRVRMVEPNHVLVRRLVEAALPRARERLPHQVAGDARVTGGAIVFTILADDPATQPRAFKARQLTGRLPASPALVAVLRLLRAAGAATLHDLAAVITVHLPRVSETEARGLVNKLAAARLLAPVVPIPENSGDITADSAAFLRGAGEEALAAELEALGAAIQDFPDADPVARRRGLGAIHGASARLHDRVGLRAPDDAPVFYEDTGIAATLPEGDLAALRRDLCELGPFIELFDTNSVLPALVSDVLVERHGRGGRVAYLDFVDACPGIFERWFDISIKNQLPADLAERHPGLAARFALRVEIGKAIAAAWDGGPEIALDRALLDRVAGALPVRDGLHSASYGVFVQPEIVNGAIDRVYVNPIYQGLGTFFSRFLPMFGPEATAAVRGNVERFFPRDHLVAGVRPVAGFNANLHPPVAPHEVNLELPGEPPGDLRLEDLCLQHDEATDTALLLHAESGRPVDVLYHGFLIPALLPSRWSLLQALASGNVYDTSLLSEIRERRPDRPRIRYGKVVLSRRHFSHPVKRVPHPEPGESDARYFIRLNLWRLEEGLPAEVFVQAPAAGGPQPKPGELWSALGWSREKPQYIDFDSSLVVRFFGRWLERRRPDGWLVATECRPLLPRSMYRSAGGGHATELVLEINRSPT